jgi:hypothetical protein
MFAADLGRSKHRGHMNLELTVAIIAGAVAVASALIAYSAQVSAAKSQSQIALVQLAAQQAHERQKPFVEAQMKLYFEAAEAAAQIPRTADSGARGKLIQRFWQLYWGPLAVVEDEEVERAMVAYGRQLKKDPLDASSLETLSLGVAHACRSSLKRLWVPELGNLGDLRPPASSGQPAPG